MFWLAVTLDPAVSLSVADGHYRAAESRGRDTEEGEQNARLQDTAGGVRGDERASDRHGQLQQVRGKG